MFEMDDNEKPGLLRTGIALRCPACRSGAVSGSLGTLQCEACDWQSSGDFPDLRADVSEGEATQAGIYDEIRQGLTQTSDPLHTFVTPSGHQKYRMLKRLPLRQGQKFLEIGGGAGPLTDSIASSTGSTGFAIDISPASVRAQLKRRGQREHYDTAAASATNLPFPDGTFDAVVAFDVIEHIERPQDLMAEAARVLSPGGTLLIRCPVMDFGGTIDWLQYSLRRRKWLKRMHDGGHLYENFRTKRQYCYLARQAGLTVAHTQGYDIFWDNLIEYYLLPLFTRQRKVATDGAPDSDAGIDLVQPNSTKHKLARLANRIFWLFLLPERLIGKFGVGASFWLTVQK